MQSRFFLRARLWAAGAAVVWLAAGAAWAKLSPEEKCEVAKNQAAGKYALCRQKAEAKAIKQGAAPDYSKCDANLATKWNKATAKAIAKGASCLDSVTAAEIQAFVTAHTDAVAAALAGGGLPSCGDGAVNAVGEQCDGADLGGANCATLGFAGGTLGCDAACGFDTSACARGALLATGQTTCWDAAGNVIPCAGTGQDGELQKGLPLAYVDNGDGTITDVNTGLMWEKKSDDGSIHDKDTQYNWADAFAVHVATLNAMAFAGHTDWRLPNVRELASLVDYGRTSPAIPPAFNAGCTSGCTVLACSCTRSFIHWSSSTRLFEPTSAWFVHFSSGNVDFGNKSGGLFVRAVRGGS